jgi:hypothetical protein
MLKMLKSKKASLSITGLGVVFLELVCFVVFLPNINAFITASLPYLASQPMAVWFVKLLPLGLVMALTLSVFKKDQQVGVA